MKKFHLFAAIGMIAFTTNSFAQVEEGTATATIIQPLTLTADADLAFGNIAVNNQTAGTLIVAPLGGGTSDGGVKILEGTITAASFTLAGASGEGYTVTLPASATIKIGATENEMTVDNFTTDLSPNTGTFEGTSVTFRVGATLNVEGDQATGDYTGNFPVTVQYN